MQGQLCGSFVVAFVAAAEPVGDVAVVAVGGAVVVVVVVGGVVAAVDYPYYRDYCIVVVTAVEVHIYCFMRMTGIGSRKFV